MKKQVKFRFLGGGCEMEVETSPFVDTAAMKEKSPQAQGCDAAMEQLIYNKKGSKIQIFLDNQFQFGE